MPIYLEDSGLKCSSISIKTGSVTNIHISGVRNTKISLLFDQSSVTQLKKRILHPQKLSLDQHMTKILVLNKENQGNQTMVNLRNIY
jgi:hypothetical protein